MENQELEILIAKLKRMSNTEYMQSGDELQDSLEDINDLLNKKFPDIKEEEC